MHKPMLIHNPRCSKSREAKAILDGLGYDYETIDYLKDGLKEKMLSYLPEFLGLSYSEMVRKKEDRYTELKLDQKTLTDEEWIHVIHENPILLERPIFINKDRAVIARPAERVKEIL